MARPLPSLKTLSQFSFSNPQSLPSKLVDTFSVNVSLPFSTAASIPASTLFITFTMGFSMLERFGNLTDLGNFVTTLSIADPILLNVSTNGFSIDERFGTLIFTLEFIILFIDSSIDFFATLIDALNASLNAELGVML